MESYFKFFHPTRTLFSLADFDPKSAPESLLSAIYFAGFISSPSRSEEIISYMHSYAIANIKKILFRVSLSSAQALSIYSFAFYLNGNSKLSRVCLSHFARMNHILGLTVNRKNLPLLDQYNRKILCNYMRLYYGWTKLGPSSYEVTCEVEETGLDIYDPKYQYLNPSLNLYNNEYLSTLYSVFCTQLAKLTNFHTAINLKFCNYESKMIEKEIESLGIKAKKIYMNAKVTLESLSDLVPEYKYETSIYLEMIKGPYILLNLCINSKILELSNYRNLDKVKDIINNCIDGWELFSNNSSLDELYSWGPHIVAFNLIQIYPYCSKSQKNIVIFILKSII
ncbi:hypothetical protein CONCODRAFT_12237 [Conidiobolus coronatus NRRL 28638]|uniref:Transcription factor domain-containing protein n=1 Tax=Conidiobolus coronatus (strain ATCC 28846 / CBS 209.66 / NRRL 28638) TaxID=796925 RepID=A0A137NTD6_CONC2|nr:hypothetical protein CONCODRAFT_12237 [Conidiobolus coronatus NRRL 28638]|eukprot:KXN66010.1 hypothetical protein CONCODRAFT_12237 [Conidiobolus coronatus NRRL 28638]